MHLFVAFGPALAQSFATLPASRHYAAMNGRL
jgi:hypothetical protein